MILNTLSIFQTNFSKTVTMVNTCYHCGDHFPTTAALFQHLGSCKEFKKAQEALQASRARNAEVYRIRELAAQKGRQEAVKTPTTTTAARGDNLERREEQAAPLAHKVPRGVQKASGSQDLNLSRDSLVDRAGNLEIKRVQKNKEQAKRERENQRGDEEADRIRVNQEEKDKVIHQKAAQGQSVQANRRYFFSPDDRKIIKTAFLFALDKDGKPKATITSYNGLMKNQKSDFYKAYDGDTVFREMVDRIMRDEGFELGEMKTKIMNCYRALHRMLPSASGISKGKATKPKTSKNSNKSPAKKKQRWDEESDSEEEDS